MVVISLYLNRICHFSFAIKSPKSKPQKPETVAVPTAFELAQIASMIALIPTENSRTADYLAHLALETWDDRPLQACRRSRSNSRFSTLCAFAFAIWLGGWHLAFPVASWVACIDWVYFCHVSSRQNRRARCVCAPRVK